MLVALLIALQGTAALKIGAPVGRRAALLSGTSIATLGLPKAAHADSIEDIAARSNAAAEAAVKAKAAKAAQGTGFQDFVNGAFNVLITGATLAVVGFAGSFLLKAKSEADSNEGSRFTQDPGGNTDGGYQNIYRNEGED